MNKHWFKGFSCVAFIRSTDTCDVIIPVSSSDDASVLRPPSAETWTDFTATDHPNQIPAANFDPRNMQGSHSELQFHWEPVCSHCLACFRLMAIAMISQQININKNKRGKRSTQTASFIAISRLLFITMATCEREPWCVPLTDVTGLYSLDMQMCWSNAHCYSLPLRQMRLILFVYLQSAFSPGKKRRHRSLDASTGLKTNADFSRVASKQLRNREVELWLLSSLISSPVEGSIGPWTWLRADWLPRWWVGGCQCEGRSCFGRACVGICSMSTCEVQKMNPISQESPTYVKYIVPLYQFIYQATECQLDSQDGAGIWRVVGAKALPQLSSSGWLHLERCRCLPLHGGAYQGVVTFPKGREASRRWRPAPKPESCRFGSAPLMKMSGRGAQAVCQMSPQPGEQMRWEDRMMKQPAAHLQLGTSSWDKLTMKEGEEAESEKLESGKKLAEGEMDIVTSVLTCAFCSGSQLECI